jgi:prepilin-type N-terminal cleavage/methylation domain-containing protein
MQQPKTHRARCPGRRRAGFTLVELLLLLTIMGIVASIAIPSMQSTGDYTVEAAARIVAADLRLARSLAVEYNTDWTVTFDHTVNIYELSHTGSGTIPVPDNPRARPGDPSGRYVVCIDRLAVSPRAGESLSVGSVEYGPTPTATNHVTFGPLGGTGPQSGSSADRAEDTVIWLTIADGDSQRSVPLTVSWVTGQVQIGDPVSL